MHFQELIFNQHVEDIVMNPRGIFWFENGHWNGPSLLSQNEDLNLEQFARYIAEKSSHNLGLTQPTVDSYVRLHENAIFRAHVVISPMVIDGPEITLRRVVNPKKISLDSFSCSPAHLTQLQNAVTSGLSIMIAGSTGSGKTSLLTSLLSLLPQNTRMIILEDSPELPVPNAISTKLLARVDRFGFRNGVKWDLKQLIFESLRMRPERLILGECRGPEAQAIAWALQTGHRGLMTTIHAGSCLQALDRFESLVQDDNQGTKAMGRMWDVVIYLDCDSTGQRKIQDILQIHKET